MTTSPLYWMNINCPSGNSSVQAVSEAVAVPGGLYGAGTTLQLEITANTTATWSPGTLTAYLDFYTASGTWISGASATSSALITSWAPSNITTIASTSVPSTAAWMIATVQVNGSPAATVNVQIAEAQIYDSNGASYNSNFSFVYNSSPWSTGEYVTTSTNVQITNHRWSSPANNAYLSWQNNPQPSNVDSLVLAGMIEILGGGAVQSQLPELVDVNGNGAIFRLLAPPASNSMAYGYEPSYDLSAPQPTQDIVQSMLLDGERPFGYRASNRTITLPIHIKATSNQQMQAAREYLMQLIDQQTWPIAYTPGSTGLTTIFDAFRALPTAVMWGFNYDNSQAQQAGIENTSYAYNGMLTLSIQALPYGRSDTDGTQQLSFASPLTSQSSAAGANIIDAFSTLPSGLPAGQGRWYLRTGQVITGVSSNSVYYQPPQPIVQPYPPAVMQRSGLSADIRSLPVMSVWFGQAYDTQWAADKKFVSDMVLNWTLTDNNGKTLSFHTTYNNLPWSTDLNNPKWTRINANIPQGQNFNYQHVTEYNVHCTNWNGRGSWGLQKMRIYLCGVTANPTTIQGAATTRAAVYNLVGFAGTARSPVSVQLQQPAAAPMSQELYGASVWYPPPGVYSAQVEAIGGGGAGATLTQAGISGGGGGGEYAQEPAFAVTPGQPVPYACGTGGVAQQTAQSVTFSNPGTGSWTVPANVSSIQVEAWGGGSAGGAGAGGGAGGGYSREAALAVTPGSVLSFTVGAGGVANSGTTSQQISARGGNKSVFSAGGSGGGYGNGQVIAYGASTSKTGSTPGGGGGVKSSNTVSFMGGNGGSSPGTGGGGGGSSPDANGAGVNGGSASSGAGGSGGVAPSDAGDPGGNGGNGATTPGYATAGSVPGGGGGGGCTNGSVNQIGANGANGQIKITYTVGNGTITNGANTTFGPVPGGATTVTAHGGSSAATNAIAGGSGGSGSSDTYHATGGSGGWSNVLSSGAATAQISLLMSTANENFTGSSATITANASQASGTSVIYLVSAAQITASVTDTAGNIYSLVQSVELGAGGAYAYAFVAPMSAPVTSGTTSITVTTGATGTYAVQWWGTPYEYGCDTGSAATATGTSTTPAVTFGTGGNGSNDFQIVFMANSGTATMATAPAAPLWNAPANNHMVNGALEAYTYVGQAAGPAATSANAASGTWSASAAWGAIAIPLYLSYSAQPPIKIAGVSLGAATTVTAAVTQNLPAGGMLVFAVAFPAASTITGPTDSGLNTYSLSETVTATSVLKIWTAPVTTALTTGNTVSLTDGTSQAHLYGLYYIPSAGSYDVGGQVSTQTANTTVTITDINTMSQQNDIEMVFFYNNSNATYSNPVGTLVPVDSETDGTAKSFGVYAYQSVSDTPSAHAATQSASVVWGAAVLSFKMPLYGGGGGGSGGFNETTLTDLPGNSATSYQGAPAVLGGGKGASGTQSVSAGVAGTPPGGGGSGTVSTGANETGGPGGAGYCVVTWQPPLQPFSTLIVHRPGVGAPPSLNPSVSLGNTATASSNTQYPVPSLISGINAQFNGTYSIALTNYYWDSPAVTRQITVTVAQYEYQGGPAYTQQLTRSITPSTDITNGIIFMGEMTLPIKDVDPSTTSGYFTVSIQDTDGSDLFLDVLFLDTTGQTTVVNIPAGNAGYGTYNQYWIDEPPLDRDLGRYLGSAMDRSQAVSVTDSAIISGGPLYVQSGSNVLLCYSITGAPSLGVSYNPRWYASRLY